MQTLSKRLSSGILFLFLVLSAAGCKVVQIQCETGKCPDLRSRLVGHEHVLTKLNKVDNGEERALTYILTTLRGQGWQIIERQTTGASLQLHPQGTAEDAIQIVVPLPDGAIDLFQSMPVMLETMQFIARAADHTQTVYLSFGMTAPDPQETRVRIHFQPACGRGGFPSISPIQSAVDGKPIHISCSSPALVSPENLYDSWTRYIKAIRDHLLPLLNVTTTTP